MQETTLIIFEYEGRERTANACRLESDHEKAFRVVMDDGYENNFLVTENEPYRWYEQYIGYTALAQAAGKALNLFFCM